MPATNYYLELIDRFLRPAIVQLGGTLPKQKMVENYEDYTLRCLALIASLLSAPVGGGGSIPADASVTTLKILDAAVTSAKIADGAITSAKILDGSIATGDIADGAITTEKIADGGIGTADIADSAISTGKIADSAITSAKIQDGAIAAVDLGTGVVTTAKIADANVTTAKIADGAITTAKIADGAVVTVDLADGAVTSAKILDGTIATADIADGAITAAKLAAGAIATASLPDSAVTGVKIAADAITSDKIATGAVNTTDLADSAVSTVKIADGAITTAKIQDGTIGTVDLADGAITAAKLSSTAAVLSLNSLKGDLTLVAGSNVVISTAGQVFTINASNAVSSLTAPTNPYPGQVWFNIAGTTVSGIPSGNHGVWNGSAWVGTGSAQPQGSLLTLSSSPSSPLIGQSWQNISGGTLSGIPSGNVGVWNGSSWVNVVHVPSTVTFSGGTSGFMASLPAAAIPDTSTSLLLLPNSKVFDTFGGYNIGTGVYTVPASQTGNWLWEFGCHVTSTSGDTINIYATKNTTTIATADLLHCSGVTRGASGTKPLQAVAGDLIRFYANSSVAHTLTAGGLVYGNRILRIS